MKRRTFINSSTATVLAFGAGIVTSTAAYSDTSGCVAPPVQVDGKTYCAVQCGSGILTCNVTCGTQTVLVTRNPNGMPDMMPC